MISPEAVYTQQKQTINSIACTTIIIIKEKETINWSVGVQRRVVSGLEEERIEREERKWCILIQFQTHLGAREVASG